MDRDTQPGKADREFKLAVYQILHAHEWSATEQNAYNAWLDSTAAWIDSTIEITGQVVTE